MSKLTGVAGRLVRSQSIQGVGRVRIGHDRDWSEYRVQVWDSAGLLVAEYHTDDRVDAIDTAGHMWRDLAVRAGVAN